MRRFVIATALLSLALLVAACGSGKEAGPRSGTSGSTADKPAEDILRDAQAAFRSARSVRVKGRLVQGTSPVELDIRSARGAGARGSIVDDGVRFSLIRSGERLWLRGERFWQRAIGEEVAGRIGERWVLVPPSAAASAGPGIDAFTDLDGILEQIITPDGELSKGGTQEIGGVPAIAVDYAGAGTLWVAAQGQPYPLRIGPKAGGNAEQFIDFAEYNKPVAIAAPKDAIEDPTVLD